MKPKDKIDNIIQIRARKLELLMYVNSLRRQLDMMETRIRKIEENL